MKTRFLASLAALAAVLLSGTLQAAILEDFRFNDADGTALNAAVNSANGGNNWVHDTGHVNTIQVQGGSLNIVKNTTDFVREGLGFADVSSGTLWMVAQFKNWAILGNAPDGNNVEEIRFGFMGTEDLVPPPSSTVLAEMMISRDFSAGEFQISGTALGAAGTSIPGQSINFVQNDPFIMAMKVNQDNNTYKLYYRDGNGPLTLVGSGNVEPTRDAIVVRMGINNFIGDEAGEFANLDRFYISDTRPVNIPEPATWLIALVAGLPTVARRRRR